MYPQCIRNAHQRLRVLTQSISVYTLPMSSFSIDIPEFWNGRFATTMSSSPAPSPASRLDDDPNQIWFTRCPVPTASGLAYKLGWLSDRFAANAVTIGILQD